MAVPTAPPVEFKKTIGKRQCVSVSEICELQPVEDRRVQQFGTLSVQKALVESLVFEEEICEDVGENAILVAPVEIGNPGATVNENFGILSLPVMQHLSRSQVAPKFSNKKEDWSDFCWKFEVWLRAISSGRKLTDNETLQLLTTCLPENLKKEVELLEKVQGKPPTYIGFRARLEARFGKGQNEHLRKNGWRSNFQGGLEKLEFNSGRNLK